MLFQAKVTDAELMKVLKNMPRATQRKVIMPALRQGGAVIRELAIANVKTLVSNEATGALQRNIRVYNSKKLRGNYRVRVQVRKGAVNAKKIVSGQPVRIGLYASVLEYGKKGQAPRSWLRKAAREGTGVSLLEIAKVFRFKMGQTVEDAKR